MESTNTLYQLKTTRLASLFILLHLVIWTIVPFYVRGNLPMDAIEGYTWGQHLAWGYDKNPFLNAFLTHYAVAWGGTSGWMVYFFSQLSVAIAFLSVWALAKNILRPAYALVAMLLLDAIQYFNLHAIDFNDNTLELSLWALTILCFYKALRSKNILPWILTGLFAGLGMMAKYYTAALLASMFLLLLSSRKERAHWFTFSLWCGVIVFVLVITPHLLWLPKHDYITVTYVFDRGRSLAQWTNHFFFPAQFVWQQLQAFFPALCLFALLFLGRKHVYVEPVTAFDRRFLVYMGVGPFLLTCLLSLVLGTKLRAGWGMPLLSLWPALLMAFLPPPLTKFKVQQLFAGMILLMILLAGGYSYSLLRSDTPSSANFPGKTIALQLTQRWHANFNRPLRFVAGPRWLAGNVAYHSSDHPSVYMEWDKVRSFWINEEEMNRDGALFMWNESENENLPAEVKARFPHLQNAETIEVEWQNNAYHLAPIRIGFAVLPPAD